MTPITRYRIRKKEEFLGLHNRNNTDLNIRMRILHHVNEGAHKMELYLDHKGWHLCAEYRERVEDE